MKTAQTLLLSALLLVAISHAHPDIAKYLQLVASDSSRACQLKYETCRTPRRSKDYCSEAQNAKQCATTGSVTNGSIAICTDTEYQRALDVICMKNEQREKLGELINAISQLSSECQSVIFNCFGRLVSPILLKEYCIAINEAAACLSFYVSVKQSCKPKYEEIKALAC